MLLRPFFIAAVWLAATLNLPAQSPTADSFNPGANNQVISLAVQPDGKILAGGNFKMLGGLARTNLGRLNTDGSLDTNFSLVTIDPGYCVSVQTNGKILTAGYYNVAQYNSNGSLDASFNAPVIGADVDALPIQADGKILVGGDFSRLNGQTRHYIGRLNADGTLDTAFNPGTDSNVIALALQADGKILVGGDFSILNGQTRHYIGRLNADGTLDTVFNPAVNDTVFSLAVQADGKILVGGRFTAVGGQPHTNIVRLNSSNGSVDSSFNLGANGMVNTMAVQTDGKILLGGYFTLLGGQTRNHLGRFNANGSLDATFDPGANDTVRSLTVQADGKIVVGGDFNTLGGQSRTNIGRLNNTGEATQSLAFNGTTITWLRGGTSPEVWRTTFDICTNGADWISLGAGQRIAGGWQRTGLNYPTNAAIRARGFICGASWFVEILFAPSAPLQFVSTDGSPSASNGWFNLRLTGTTGVGAVVECSPNLTTWTPWQTNTLPANGWDLAMPMETNQQQFFRARLASGP